MNKKTSPTGDAERRRTHKQITVSMVFIALLLLVFIPLASTNPDGLEKAAQAIGLAGSEPLWPGLFPDYLASVGGTWLGTSLVGIVGAIIVFATVFLIAKILTPRSKKKARVAGLQ